MTNNIGILLLSPSRYMSIRGAARLLGITKGAVRNWIKQGLKCYRDGEDTLALVSYVDLREFVLKKKKKRFYELINKFDAIDEIEKKAFIKQQDYEDKQQ